MPRRERHWPSHAIIDEPYRPLHALIVKSLIFDLRVSASICGRSCYSRFIRVHSRTGFSTGAILYA
ncbi:hypothetical protein SALB1_1252 [Salinisphaera sp. LB1]|nr:hypothetical protein SALB1_1252 [Salinisphaera sp. LB1]